MNSPITRIAQPHSRVARRAMFRTPPDSRTASALLAAHGLSKSYRKGSVEIPVLQNVDFSVDEAEFCAIVGQSGSGKSTLLHLLATLDVPDAGQILYEGNRIDTLSARGRDVLRNRHFGMIFQFYHLLPELTTLENVLLPLLISSTLWGYLSSRATLRRRAEELLNLVGLSHRLRHLPRELSGGEMQRTAIARALMSEPRVLLADEPTGNLDQKSGDEILELLHRLNEQRLLTIVMVTHDLSIARMAHRFVRLANNALHIETKPCP